MTLQKALENFTQAKEAINDHIQANKKTFDAHEQLVGKLIDAENELRDVVQLEKQNIENDRFRVVYSPVFKRYYDGRVILEKATPKAKKALIEQEVITYEINKDEFEKLVEQGLIPVELKQEAYREKERNPRITIREVK